MRILVIATAAKAERINTLLFEKNHGDVFQSGLVPENARPGRRPTHFWATWPEDQFKFLDRAQSANEVSANEAKRISGRHPGSPSDIKVFRFDANLDVEKTLAALGLKRSDVDYVAPPPPPPDPPPEAVDP